MSVLVKSNLSVSKRVRAILLTQDNQLFFIKRVKPNKPEAYWVAPGGGVEDEDDSLLDTLERELHEELGATFDIIEHVFILEHKKADKQLEEHFYVCRLQDYDLNLRSGPEFDDPTRGQYIPDIVPLKANAIAQLNIKTTELQDWLLNNLEYLRHLRTR